MKCLPLISLHKLKAPIGVRSGSKLNIPGQGIASKREKIKLGTRGENAAVPFVVHGCSLSVIPDINFRISYFPIFEALLVECLCNLSFLILRGIKEVPRGVFIC